MVASGLLNQQFIAGVAIALALGLLLLALLPRERAAVRGTLVLLGVFVGFRLLALATAALGSARGAALLGGIAVVGVGAVVIRMAGLGVFRLLLPRMHLSLPRIAEDLFITALAAGWLVFWLHLAGVELGSLLATSAVITAVLAFAMQDTLGNVLGGVVLQLDDSLRVGDWVVIDAISGQVVDVRWRHTAIETRNRETVVIPNGWLVKNRFTVIGSRSDPKIRWRRWIWFNIDPAAAPGRVLETLEEAVRESDLPNVLHDPPPSAVLMEVGQGYLRFALRYWLTDPRPDDPTDTRVRMLVLAALARHDIRLAVVREERLVVAQDEGSRAAQQVEQAEQRRAALNGVDLFSTLQPDELEALAGRLKPASFVRGSTITRQGRVAHWLYLIVSGEVDVWAEDGGGRRTHVATLNPGSVVGEMGMMTGEPRRATVTARTDVECFRLGKAGFESVLLARPDLANEISRIIAARRGQLDSAREAASAGIPAAVHQDAILARIRGFFGLG